MGISLSPTLCHMLTDDFLIQRYLEYTEKQIEFGEQELDRTAGESEHNSLVKFFYDRVVERKAFFTGRYDKNILKGFDYYQKKGRLEIMATSATHSFLPFYTTCPEAVQAQFEVAISTYRFYFGKIPQGFWLPELGWKADLDSWLRSYNFAYTMVDAHALVFARPFAEKGSFYPARTPLGVIVFGRDFYAAEDMAKMTRDPLYRYNSRDQGFELPADRVKPFLGPHSSRTGTGYKYWAVGQDGSGSVLYNPALALEKVKGQARAFLDAELSRLKTAGELMDGSALSLCAFEADSFGRFWYEGPEFIEALFREGAKLEETQFMAPTEYLCKQDPSTFQNLTPEYSSWGVNGYAETWLDASNDWMYRHTMRAVERMVEITERFPNNTGLKERALNQAAREILLVLASDWSKMLYKQENTEYARNQIESSLRNFTTIYEALGSNYISTEWLTHIEKRHNIFPNINYRVFRRKN
uniref:Glycoside hydrolase, family 57 n=1 Tax=uncultured bacterium contig00014 TaxID=1181505 RepID=A0A806KQX5_9BACT|nr:glycoside hydrolase, family 57 [uncultured bacterium contig00014]